MWVLLLTSASALNVKEFIPEKAFNYTETIMTEIYEIFPEIPDPAVIFAIIEQESCTSLTNTYCWNPKAKLSTRRELGLGLGMLTIAYDKTGKVRFDNVILLRLKYPSHLNELTKDNILSRPDLQIRAIVLLLKENYDALDSFSDPDERLMAAVSAYNGGVRDVQRQQAICKLIDDCDPETWIGNVGAICVKSRVAIYGRRSACDINMDYTNLIYNFRLKKYQKLVDDYES